MDVGKLCEVMRGGAREEGAAQAERWVARAEKTAVATHLLGLVLSLSELAAMLHVHLWRFIKHVSREGAQYRQLCRSARQKPLYFLPSR